MMDNRGVAELPLQYLIIIIIACAIISAIFYSGYNMWKDVQIKDAIREVKKIIDEAELMYVQADEGTIRWMKISLPSSVGRVVFGSDNKIQSNCIEIYMKWGEKKVMYSEAKFRGENGDFAIIYPDDNLVKLKLEMMGEKYVEICAG